MRIFLALLVLTCCLSNSNATLRLLKSKVNASPTLQRVVQYLAAPDLVHVPVPYSHPSYSTHVSAFSVSLPGVQHQPVTTTIGLPHVHHEAIYAPAVVPQSFAVGGPHFHYLPPETEPFIRHFVEEHYGEHYLPPNSNW